MSENDKPKNDEPAKETEADKIDDEKPQDYRISPVTGGQDAKNRGFPKPARTQ